MFSHGRKVNMRKSPTKKIERFRVREGVLGSDIGDRYGAFVIPGPGGGQMSVIVSDGGDWDLEGPSWEHVSVSTRSRTPTWEQMDYVRNIFWGPDETVIQFHVPHSDHVNVHDNCLHLWKPIGVEIPRPPISAV